MRRIKTKSRTNVSRLLDKLEVVWCPEAFRSTHSEFKRRRASGERVKAYFDERTGKVELVHEQGCTKRERR